MIINSLFTVSTCEINSVQLLQITLITQAKRVLSCNHYLHFMFCFMIYATEREILSPEVKRFICILTTLLTTLYTLKFSLPWIINIVLQSSKNIYGKGVALDTVVLCTRYVICGLSDRKGVRSSCVKSLVFPCAIIN